MTKFDGLSLWNAVEEVDKRYTKKIEGREFTGDTVNLCYTTKKLTEVLGPAGMDWGWEVIDERVHQYGSHENKDFTAIHSVRMRLWIRRDDGTTGHIEDYGTTKLAYYTNKGYLKTDEEAMKKSASDAKSKLFVALGGSAQVWLGEFDRTQHKYMGRDDDRQARAPRPAAPAPVQGDSDGDRLALASRPAALPPGQQGSAGEPTPAEPLILHAREIMKNVRTASTPAAVIEAARKVKGTFGQQPFWPQIVATDRDFAAEMQSALRSKAAAYEVDLQTLTAKPPAVPEVTDDHGEPAYKLDGGEHVPAKKWIEAAERTIRSRIASGLDPRVWWEGQKAERARLRKRKELHDALDDLNALVEASPAIPARPNAHVSPDRAMRAG